MPTCVPNSGLAPPKQRPGEKQVELERPIQGKYKNYGCFCDFRVSGTTVDKLDRCCQIHEHCYAQDKKLEN
ncbi:hypothetical protein A6R68_20996 [Neotoma lepida]|uniref:Phospholipase A2 n=1 Tax=Neotoma lepida TaxID=56216 RepID=A0A1A6HRG6_NEOLE|nr:hypothetical protein A6R68_20996 [Neotoma lepida]